MKQSIKCWCLTLCCRMICLIGLTREHWFSFCLFNAIKTICTLELRYKLLLLLLLLNSSHLLRTQVNTHYYVCCIISCPPTFNTFNGILFPLFTSLDSRLVANLQCVLYRKWAFARLYKSANYITILT